MFEHCRWHNEPKVWRAGADHATVTTDAGTDFWRETHYGMTRDSGHFLGQEVGGDFTATLRVRGRYETLYDQAGIMVRRGDAMLGSVLTVGMSDWATCKFWGDASDVWLRVTVAKDVLRLQVSADGLRWPLLRLCPFPMGDKLAVGPMCCTPERGGLHVRFSDFSVGPANGKDLHDLS